MKFLFCTDLHLRPTKPENRTDDFRETCLDKLRQIQEIASHQGCHFIICGGDFFHACKPSLGFAREVAEIIAEGSLDWHTAIGNHDLIGHNTETYKAGIMGMMEMCSRFFILNEMPSTKVEIKPFHYCHGIDQQTEFFSDSEAKTKIYVVHSMITDKSCGYDHVLIDDIETDADLILSGHYHPGFDPTSCNGTMFVNPGSLTRMTTHEHNMSRIPMVVIVEADEENIEIKQIELKCEPAENVFDFEKVERNKEWEKGIAKFVRMMESAEFQGKDLRERVTKCAEEMEVEPEVVEYAMSKLDQVQEERSG